MEVDSSTIHDAHEIVMSYVQSNGLKLEDAVIKHLDDLLYPRIKDFAPGLEWFNVSEPLSFVKHLKGKLVVLDFFTYCCINCMHILPDLKEIEHEFSPDDGLVVIGVHSPKFENEKGSSNVLAAVQRYNITHPVINDSSNDLWGSCEISCWPTLLLVNPEGVPIVALMGEGHKENLRLYIKQCLQYYRKKGSLSSHKLPIKSAYHLLPVAKGPLLFPGKIASFHEGDDEILAIADTGNNRILIVVNQAITEIIGRDCGFRDGNFTHVEFNQPQGLTFESRHVIYVADTENHAIRRVDLKNKMVETVAGNGKQSDDKAGGKIGFEQGLSSPWDVCLYDTSEAKVLLIAMAGTHQIWGLFLRSSKWWKGRSVSAGEVIAIAGNGREENRNNQYPMNAAFAQPSGLTLCDNEVYIADSESSCIRKLSLIDGKVSPVVGGDRNPNNLFAFGDKDGKLQEAKLQHPLGLTALNKQIYVTDTYNNKIKLIDITRNTITTLPTPGDIFNEPSGLCTSKIPNTLYLADTNNHKIKTLLVENDEIKSINDLILKSDIKLSKLKQHHKILSRELHVNKSANKIIMNVKLLLQEGMEITKEAPNKWSVELNSPLWSCTPSSGDDLSNIDFVVNTVLSEQDQNYFDVIFKLISCFNDSCYPKDFVLRHNLVFNNESDGLVLNETVKVKIAVDKEEII